MNFKRILIYLLVALVAGVVWVKNRVDQQQQINRLEKFADVYSATAVWATLLRNEKTRFEKVRDSIYTHYNFNADSVAAFRAEFEGKEESWRDVWSLINYKVDSMIEYYDIHPITHGPVDRPDVPEPDTADSNVIVNPYNLQ